MLIYGPMTFLHVKALEIMVVQHAAHKGFAGGPREAGSTPFPQPATLLPNLADAE